MRIIIQRQKIDKKIKDNYQKDLKNEFKIGLILYKHCVKKKGDAKYERFKVDEEERRRIDVEEKILFQAERKIAL